MQLAELLVIISSTSVGVLCCAFGKWRRKVETRVESRWNTTLEVDYRALRRERKECQDWPLGGMIITGVKSF